MELPTHPEADEPSPRRQPSTNTRWATIVIVGVISVLVILILVLHLTGVVGPAAH